MKCSLENNNQHMLTYISSVWQIQVVRSALQCTLSIHKAHLYPLSMQWLSKFSSHPSFIIDFAKSDIKRESTGCIHTQAHLIGIGTLQIMPYVGIDSRFIYAKLHLNYDCMFKEGPWRKP